MGNLAKCNLLRGRCTLLLSLPLLTSLCAPDHTVINLFMDVENLNSAYMGSVQVATKMASTYMGSVHVATKTVIGQEALQTTLKQLAK